MSIGNKLKALRAKFGLSQGDFAKSINYSQNYISLCERGVCSPSLKLLVAIKNKYEVSIDFLVDEKSIVSFK